MQWTVRLEAKTGHGELETTELVTLRRPVAECSLPDLGLALAEAKALLTKLQWIMVRSQAAEYVAGHTVCDRTVLIIDIQSSAEVLSVAGRGCQSRGAASQNNVTN
ncbi:hypothetical protein [Paracraurococcus lichenis]|uniref:Uncharacterized protein n=1 Tax=Paracraurococcus lichenis TaxID=3064888 RepID=A0ABT9EAY2_9PROT|nr:hypothetical protein [Paracraurococcus sp. LOR1-02]MDO9713070.1 hypothetical protein [Paracraurococcus sp. LOR1-02]